MGADPTWGPSFYIISTCLVWSDESSKKQQEDSKITYGNIDEMREEGEANKGDGKSLIRLRRRKTVNDILCCIHGMYLFKSSVSYWDRYAHYYTRVFIFSFSPRSNLQVECWWYVCTFSSSMELEMKSQQFKSSRTKKRKPQCIIVEINICRIVEIYWGKSPA